MDRTNLNRAKTAFLHRFEGGFEDPAYLEGGRNERSYKVAARDLLREQLSEGAFRNLLKDRDYAEVAIRARRVVSKTNLITHFETRGWRASSPRQRQEFAERLFELLYGRESFRARFEGFTGILREVGSLHWTLQTYFPFLADPKEYMYLKPLVTKRAAQFLDFNLEYQAQPNWHTYSKLQEFAAHLTKELTDLDMKPADNIDLQSFIWCTFHAGFPPRAE